MKGKSYHHIDEDIRYLVACMNAYGFRTYASCQGHGYPVDSVMPYIAFCAKMLNQANLNLTGGGTSPAVLIQRISSVFG